MPADQSPIFLKGLESIREDGPAGVLSARKTARVLLKGVHAGEFAGGCVCWCIFMGLTDLLNCFPPNKKNTINTSKQMTLKKFIASFIHLL